MKITKISDIKKEIEGKSDDDEFTFSGNVSIDYDYTKDGYAEMDIQKIRLSVVQVRKILAGKNIETVMWEGMIIKDHNTDEEVQKSEPGEIAFGGFGNTEGSPEWGELSVDEDMILGMDEMIERDEHTR